MTPTEVREAADRAEKKHPGGDAAVKPRGRPTEYTSEIAASICAGLAEGRSLRDVCSDEGMPSESTVRTWALDDREGFSAQYTKAREVGYHAMADELMDIADNGSNDWMERRGSEDAGWVANGEHIQRSRLRVDARKWMLSKVLPKVYGDKQTLEHTGADGGPIKTQSTLDLASLTDEELAAYRIVAAAAERNREGD